MFLFISDEVLCGLDLEYDVDFMVLECVVMVKVECVIGDEVKVVEELDWDWVKSLVEGLLGCFKDLCVVMYLFIVWLCIGGFVGLVGGLVLVCGMLENYWDGVYLMLDVEDDDDFIVCVNVVVLFGELLGVFNYLCIILFV